MRLPSVSVSGADDGEKKREGELRKAAYRAELEQQMRVKQERQQRVRYSGAMLPVPITLLAAVLLLQQIVSG